MVMDHLKIMALKVPRPAFCVSTSFSRTFSVVAQMLALVLLCSDHRSAGTGSVVIMGWDTQPSLQKHPKTPETKPLTIIILLERWGLRRL